MATGLRALSALTLSLTLTAVGLGGPAQARAGTPLPDLGLLREGRTPAPLTGGAALRPRAASTTLTDGQYVVRLREAPVTSYSGGVAGLAATEPATGQDLQPHSAAAEKYRAHLGEAQRDVLDDLGVNARQTYTTAFNGFTAELTGAQATTLAKDPRVAAVSKAQVVKADAATLGGSGETTGAGAAPKPVPGKGSGVVVGVIDTGIWPESASFAATMPAPKGWHGTCQVGDGFPATACNGKIVGARYRNAGLCSGLQAGGEGPRWEGRQARAVP
ncbi:S8 family serine peptidase [Actinoplanes cyaneus]|uniref:S8 family serine peptidase n=2 Tax=Actinoplanes cyaneus TaxID=52696 RepID=UPI00222637F8|nr:S8 family serine peptidase [Actinoplanes cyaneus]